MGYFVFNETNLMEYNSSTSYCNKSFFLLVNGLGGTKLGEKASSLVLKKILSYLDLEKDGSSESRFIEATKFANKYLIDFAIKNDLYKLIGASFACFIKDEATIILNGGTAAYFYELGKELLEFKGSENNIPTGFLGINTNPKIIINKIKIKEKGLVILMTSSLLRFLTKDKIKNIITDNISSIEAEFFSKTLAGTIFKEAKNLGYSLDSSIIVIKV